MNTRASFANYRGLRSVTVLAAALMIAVAGAACGSSQPTPIVIYVTPRPTPIIIYVTPTPNVSTTGTPATATATPEPFASPSPSASAVPTTSPSNTASAGPTSPAALCIGGPNNQAWFADTANTLKFDVYCGHVSKGWGLISANYELPKTGGWLKISYSGPGGATVDVSEGAFCLTSSAACSPNTGSLGTGKFAGLSGALDLTVDGFAIYVSPGTKSAYQIVCKGLTQTTFQNIAASLVRVPKS